ncbi:MAG TPA: aminotransferase class III-fold pyridoxal phosphate-dependent enzyme [Polyangiaceae bacterium]|nr:aminotransferase class III-fold pyridoxal phosphate-dependent enzyme [Polyangiaceae bacterium]
MIDKIAARLLLSRAKHPSLRGHARISLRVAKWMPFYEYDEEHLFASDGAALETVNRRREGFERLASRLAARKPKTLAASAELARGLSDVQFVDAYRVPYQYRRIVAARLPVGSVVEETDGPRLRDLDGNWSWDLGGSYGVNLFGHRFYERAMESGFARARKLGVVLGNYSPIVLENVNRLREISGKDEVSFHMSGTEAVMQAVRLARYHTGRTHLVRFCGAYHGWWDGVQAGIGNPIPPRHVYTLKEVDEDTLRVLETRSDVACVLVNSIQALHPNAAPPSDSTLVASDRSARYDRAAYTRWLHRLRDTCTRRGIVLIIDDVFMGFRLARGGTQEYFGVPADLVTYGKTLGGGLPVGVVCGRADLMKRYRDDRPGDVCFARGTFNSHPVVMGTMNEFLRYLDSPEAAESYAGLEERWNRRARELNGLLRERGLPVLVENLISVWTTLYTEPGRYNWMLQYYLRAEGLAPSWIGTGRFIFSHDLGDEDFGEIRDRFVRAAEAMRADGFLGADAALTNSSIKRRVLGELLSAATAGLSRNARARRPSGPAIRP